MKKWISFFIITGMAVYFTGCSTLSLIDEPSLSGRIFTHVKIPLTTDLNDTPSGVFQGTGMIVRITEPITEYNFYAEFNSNAIGDVAKKLGINKIYYVDLEVFDVLGVWTHKKIIIYGE